MASSNGYYDDMRTNPEIIDASKNEDLVDVSETVNDPIQYSPKSNISVSSNVRELLECPVCLNAMYPPIHQVWLFILFFKSIGFLCLFVIILFLITRQDSGCSMYTG